MTDHQNEIAELGFSLIPDVYSRNQVERILHEIQLAMQQNTSGGIKSQKGETYAARNLAVSNPNLLKIWESPKLLQQLRRTLGDEFGLVRVLFFDKHPNRSWSLPWHKDVTIAVKDNTLPSENFSKPTKKAGVPHVEASTDILQKMLTMRIHLDQITSENGPLQVAAGSHLNGKKSVSDNQATRILSAAGDVLAMRPLVSHASASSTPGTSLHRRILHLEFAGCRNLPDRYDWQMFHQPSKTLNGQATD